MTPNDIPAYMARVGAGARAAATAMAAAPAAAKDQALRALATRLRAGLDALQAANAQDLQAAQAMHHGKGLAAPLEFMQRLAALVPRPHLHGVLAPSSTTSAKLRAMLLPQGPDESTEATPPATCEANSAHHRPVRLSWARLLKRVPWLDLKHCPNCGGELTIIAAILEQPVIEKISSYLGQQARARFRCRRRQPDRD